MRSPHEASCQRIASGSPQGRRMPSATIISIGNLACGFVHVGLLPRCRSDTLDFRSFVGAAAIWRSLVPVRRTGLDFPGLFRNVRTSSGSLQRIGSRGADT
jgi:hypothetical protein